MIFQNVTANDLATGEPVTDGERHCSLVWHALRLIAVASLLWQQLQVVGFLVGNPPHGLRVTQKPVAARLRTPRSP